MSQGATKGQRHCAPPGEVGTQGHPRAMFQQVPLSRLAQLAPYVRWLGVAHECSILSQCFDKRGGLPSQRSSLRPQASTSSPGHSRGRFVQARPAMHPAAACCEGQAQQATNQTAMKSTPHRATLCSPAQTANQTPASACAPAPLLRRRRALLLHVALPAPSATHMHAATAGPDPAPPPGPALPPPLCR